LCEEEEIFFIEDLVGNSKISQFKISKKILKISRANQKFWDKNKQNWKNSFEKNDSLTPLQKIQKNTYGKVYDKILFFIRKNQLF